MTADEKVDPNLGAGTTNLEQTLMVSALEMARRAHRHHQVMCETIGYSRIVPSHALL